MFKRNILVIFLVGVFALPGTLLAQETEKQRMIREIVSVGNSLDQLFEAGLRHAVRLVCEEDAKRAAVGWRGVGARDVMLTQLGA